MKGRRLIELTLSDSVTSIGVRAFYNCNSLTSYVRRHDRTMECDHRRKRLELQRSRNGSYLFERKSDVVKNKSTRKKILDFNPSGKNFIKT